MGFGIRNRSEAMALGGLALEAWDSAHQAAAIISAATGGVMPSDPTPPKEARRSKLEAAFEERAVAWYGRDRVFYEQVKLRLAGRCYYTPDYFIDDTQYDPRFWFWETKGPHAREDGIIKLKQAAERYPMFGWVLVTRPKPNRWECRAVDRSGIHHEPFCPRWLR